MPLSPYISPESSIKNDAPPTQFNDHHSRRVTHILGAQPRRESWVDGHMGPKVLFDQATAGKIDWKGYYGF